MPVSVFLRTNYYGISDISFKPQQEIANSINLPCDETVNAKRDNLKSPSKAIHKKAVTLKGARLIFFLIAI